MKWKKKNIRSTEQSDGLLSSEHQHISGNVYIRNPGVHIYILHKYTTLCLQFDNSNNMHSNCKKIAGQEMTLIVGH